MSNLDITYTDGGSMPSIYEMDGIKEKVAQSIKDKMKEYKPTPGLTNEMPAKELEVS